MPILAVRNLSYHYQDGDYRRYVLRDINAEFEKGKFYAILGLRIRQNNFPVASGRYGVNSEGIIEFEGTPIAIMI